MQIITVDNEQFAELVEVVKQGKLVGTYFCDNSLQTIHVTNQFVVISPEKHPGKVAYKPAKSIDEAEYIATQILRKEEARGSSVEYVKTE